MQTVRVRRPRPQRRWLVGLLALLVLITGGLVARSATPGPAPAQAAAAATPPPPPLVLTPRTVYSQEPGVCHNRFPYYSALNADPPADVPCDAPAARVRLRPAPGSEADAEANCSGGGLWWAEDAQTGQFSCTEALLREGMCVPVFADAKADGERDAYFDYPGSCEAPATAQVRDLLPQYQGRTLSALRLDRAVPYAPGTRCPTGQVAYDLKQHGTTLCGTVLPAP